MKLIWLAAKLQVVCLLIVSFQLSIMRRSDYVSHWLLFSSTQNGFSQLFVLDTQTSEISALTNTNYDSIEGTWSPNGLEVAFASNRTGNWEIYTMRLNGSRLQRLTHHFRDDLSPTWSPDGQWLAFTSNRESSWEIYRVHRDGSQLEKMTNEDNWNISPEWSPTSTEFGFVRRTSTAIDSIYLSHAAGIEKLITTQGDDVGFSWSPDGEWVVFSAEMNNQASNIYRIHVLDGVMEQLTSSPARELFPDWSSDGKQIAFLSNTGGNWNIFTISTDGKNPQQITHDARYTYRMPIWSPSPEKNWNPWPTCILGISTLTEAAILLMFACKLSIRIRPSG